MDCDQFAFITFNEVNYLMGCKKWIDDIPRVKPPLNWMFFLINLVWVGYGTMLSACINEGTFNLCQLIIGIL